MVYDLLIPLNVRVRKSPFLALLGTCAQIRAETLDHVRVREPMFLVGLFDAPRLLTAFNAQSSIIILKRLSISIAVPPINPTSSLYATFNRKLEECRRLLMDRPVEELELRVALPRDSLGLFFLDMKGSLRGLGNGGERTELRAVYDGQKSFMHTLGSLGRFKKVHVAWLGGGDGKVARLVHSQLEGDLLGQLLLK